MPIRGWVYVITNKAMPGLIKVGYSTKDPQIRAGELNHTGSPHPYSVEYDVLVSNPKNFEAKVHSALINKREGKEWFRCPVREAIEAIRVVTDGQAIVEKSSITSNTAPSEKTPQFGKEKGVFFHDSSYCYGCHTLVKFDMPVHEATFSICPKCGRVVRSQSSYIPLPVY